MIPKICTGEDVGGVVRFFGNKVKCFFTTEFRKENILFPFEESGIKIPPEELVILDTLSLKRNKKIRVLFSPSKKENSVIRYSDSTFLISTVRPAISIVGKDYLPIGMYMRINNGEELWAAGSIWKEEDLENFETVLMIFSGFYGELIIKERIVMIGPTPNHLKNNLKKLEIILAKSFCEDIDVYVADSEVGNDKEFVSIYYFKSL